MSKRDQFEAWMETMDSSQDTDDIWWDAFCAGYQAALSDLAKVCAGENI